MPAQGRIPDPAEGCRYCGGDADRLFEGSPAVLRCRRCGLMGLAEIPAAEEWSEQYGEEYYDKAKGERFAALFEHAVRLFRRLRVRDILRREPGPASILDVGCGRGLLLELFSMRGWTATGTQLSRTAAAAAARRGLDAVLVGELPEMDLPPGSFRVATFFHVLEHVDRPAAYLEAARALLEDDGLLVVEVPDHGGTAFRLLGRRHFCFDYPHHLTFFTAASLRSMLEGCGFSIEETRRFSLEYSPFSTLQNMLNFLPGPPNRFYRALMRNREGAALRRRPATWAHAVLAALLAPAAFLVSAAALILPVGNTVRLYARKRKGR